MNPPVVSIDRGNLPLLLSIPHGGEHLPSKLARRMTPAAHKMADTDWHLYRLYEFARRMGATVVRANYSRYAIDVNRPSDGQVLYPGQHTTGLCPIESFRGEPLYLEADDEPDATETAERVNLYWKPYHDTIQRELVRLRQQNPHVLMWEAHSICSVLPRLFAGQLPDLNIGTFSGKACAPELREAAIRVARDSGFNWVIDERFKGGYITRTYGRPEEGVHVVQLEMTHRLYMNEDEPFEYRADQAAKVLPTIEAMVNATLDALTRLT